MAEATETTEAIPKRPRSIDAVVQRIAEISTLPQIALRVNEVARDPKSGARDLKEVVENDPALCTRVLRTVNSAAYALGSKITSLHHAISYLGFNKVRNLAVTAVVSQVFKDDRAFGPYRRSMLWQHMVSVALCARLIARRFDRPNFEDAFLAGLLHDIGIVLEDQYVHPNFRYLIGRLSEEQSLAEVEQELLGFDHMMLGARVSEQWKFPAVVRNAIRFHHMSLNYNGEDADITRFVEVANAICTVKGITSVGLKLVRPPIELFGVLNLTKEDILVVANDLDQELSRNQGLFELSREA